MKKPTRIVLVVVVLAAIAAAAVYAFTRGKGDGKDGGPKMVEVTRGTIVDKALATGQVVPEQEIQVKSQISGTITKAYVDVGDRIEKGQPLFDITPDPTPMEVAEAERRLQLAQVAYEKAATDARRDRSLSASGIVAQNQLDVSGKAEEQSRIELEMARERLQLTRDGKLARSRGGVDSTIRAPASGTVLERLVNPGDPVVPLTSYQAGTALMAVADMSKLIFKGTVDEIDVGKLKLGLPVRLQIGALPSSKVEGRLTNIAPKAKTSEGATLFDVEAEIAAGPDTTLRAGYSSTADIVIAEKTGVLLLPERVVSFEGEKAFVQVPAAKPDAKPERREIQVGLSDGLNVEVLSGLTEGQKVLEPEPKTIE